MSNNSKAPGIPQIPTKTDVTRFKPICMPQLPPIWLITNINTPPNIEFIIIFIIFHIGILNNAPSAIISITHPAIIIVLLMSKVIPPF